MRFCAHRKTFGFAGASFSPDDTVVVSDNWLEFLLDTTGVFFHFASNISSPLGELTTDFFWRHTFGPDLGSIFQYISDCGVYDLLLTPL